MVTRDAFGNLVQEGDSVSFPISLGVFVIGKVEKLSTLEGPPLAHINVTLPISVFPNGVIQGVTKVETQENNIIKS